MALLKYKDNNGTWITMFKDFMAAVKNRLRVDKNLGDVADVSISRANLGLTGDNNHTHYHDDRYLGRISAEAHARNEAVTNLNSQIEVLRRNLNSISTDIDTRISDLENTTNSRINNLTQNTNQRFSSLEQTINNGINALRAQLTDLLNQKARDLESKLFSNITGLRREISQYNTSSQERDSVLDNRINELKGLLEQRHGELIKYVDKKVASSIQEIIDRINQQKKELQQEIENLINKDKIDAKKTPGYVQLNNGLIIQYGVYKRKGGEFIETFNFNRPFPNEVFCAFGGPQSCDINLNWTIFALSKTQFGCYTDNGGGQTFAWMAIGY